MKNTEPTFKDYALEILPDKFDQIKALIPEAFSVKELFGRGQGEKSILRKLKRTSDFKGLYAFIEDEEIVYVGTSEKVINRLTYQIKGYTKYQAHLAWELAKENNLYISKKRKTPNLAKAKKLIMNMKVIFMEVNSPIERQLLEIYCCMNFHCKYNFFDEGE